MSSQVSGHKDAVSLFEDMRKAATSGVQALGTQYPEKIKMHLAKAEALDQGDVVRAGRRPTAGRMRFFKP